MMNGFKNGVLFAAGAVILGKWMYKYGYSKGQKNVFELMMLAEAIRKKAKSYKDDEEEES